MPLETATYIADLNPSNPVHGDQLSQDDAHARLIKQTIKNTFPNFTSAVLNSTQAALDAAATTVANGVTILADAGVNFKTNTGDGLTNPAAGEVDIKVGGSSALKVTAAVVQPLGSGVLAGPGTMPIGGSCGWWTNTLPTGVGTFAWLNGQAISRTTFAALFALWGTTYGAGDGSTTFNVPDTRSNVLVGNATMGGAADPSRLLSQAGRSTLGALFGVGTYTLALGDIPAHSHTGSGTTSGQSNDHTHPYTGSGNLFYAGGGTGPSLNANNGNNTGGTSQDHTHSFAFTTNSQGGGAAHINVQPSVVCNHIVRVL